MQKLLFLGIIGAMMRSPDIGKESAGGGVTSVGVGGLADVNTPFGTTQALTESQTFKIDYSKDKDLVAIEISYPAKWDGSRFFNEGVQYVSPEMAEQFIGIGIAQYPPSIGESESKSKKTDKAK